MYLVMKRMILSAVMAARFPVSRTGTGVYAFVHPVADRRTGSSGDILPGFDKTADHDGAGLISEFDEVHAGFKSGNIHA